VRSRTKVLIGAAAVLVLLLAAAVPVALFWKEQPRRIPAKGVTVLAFSPGGELLLAGSEKLPLRVYSVPEGALVREIEPLGEGARSIQFFPGGDKILSCGASKELSVLRWPDGKLLQQVAIYCDAALLSPAGDQIATIGQSRVQLQAVAPEIGRLVADLAGDGPPRSLSFSRKGDLLAFAETRRDVTWVCSSAISGAKQTVPGDAVAFAPGTGSVVLAQGKKHRLSFRSEKDIAGPPVAEIEAKEGRGAGLAFSPDGSLLVYGRAGEVFSVDAKKRVSIGHRRAEDLGFKVLALSDRYAAGATEEEILIWRAR
jgi:hypothetical protein